MRCIPAGLFPKILRLFILGDCCILDCMDNFAIGQFLQMNKKEKKTREKKQRKRNASHV